MKPERPDTQPRSLYEFNAQERARRAAYKSHPIRDALREALSAMLVMLVILAWMTVVITGVYLMSITPVWGALVLLLAVFLFFFALSLITNA